MKRFALCVAVLVGVSALSSCNIAKGLVGTSTRLVESAGRSVGM
ncbi:MAG: hypothetical protein WCO57_09540 [Verrucomicrobiota bacterium]